MGKILRLSNRNSIQYMNKAIKRTYKKHCAELNNNPWISLRVTIRPGFLGFVLVLCGVSRCPDDLCKSAKLSQFLTYKEGKPNCQLRSSKRHFLVNDYNRIIPRSNCRKRKILFRLLQSSGVVINTDPASPCSLTLTV